MCFLVGQAITGFGRSENYARLLARIAPRHIHPQEASTKGGTNGGSVDDGNKEHSASTCTTPARPDTRKETAHADQAAGGARGAQATSALGRARDALRIRQYVGEKDEK
ncbi:hypothetical protein B0H16DRAFT_1462012 [Mycena metata]|uniref:Uncharacterized protein n=1 Tax=Mycena metata TaxID=1033252 RepID=A0AAD7N6C1_9AGAR|nr:hypothetical protein B0H16DRAFT_1462012 [Mycena metata]